MIAVKFTDENYVTMLSRLRHRAEKEAYKKDYYTSYVPVIEPESLASPNTQVLYGRNGTGKTHILRSFVELCAEDYEKLKIIPAYFDMRKMNVSRISPDMDEAEIVKSFYKDLFYSIVQSVEQFADEVIPPERLETIGFGKAFQIKSQLKSSIKNIRKAFSLSNIDERVDQYVRQIKDEANKSASGSAKVGAGEAGLSGELSLSATGTLLNQQSVELIIKGVHAVDFDSITREIGRVCDTLSATHIVVLLDEWSQIDTSLQPVFAELLRRTICVSDRVTLKIAALKYLTRFSTNVGQRPIGFQTGVDITELTDLNLIFTFDLERETVRSFLLRILGRHVIVELFRMIVEAAESDIDLELRTSGIVDNVGRLFSRLTTEIFESREAFEYFFRASEGNPRDFLAMVGECCTTHGKSLPISKSAVQASVINYFSNVKVANFSGTLAPLRLFDEIFAFCIKKKTKVFTVSQATDRESSLLSQLWYQRIIHIIDNDYTYFDSDTGLIQSFSVYTIDYGKILSLHTDEEGSRVLDSLLVDSKLVVDGMYDGDKHRTILERLADDDEELGKLVEIFGSAPIEEGVTDQSDFMQPNVLFERLQFVNVDEIIDRFDDE